MQNYLTLLIISFCFGQSAFATGPAGECAALMDVPARFRHAVQKYADSPFVTPLAVNEFDHVGRGFELWLESTPPEVPGEDGFRPHAVRAVGSYGEDVAHQLKIEGIDLPNDLAREYAYRVVLAHLLNEFEDVAQIQIDMFETPDFGLIKDGLADGSSLNEAANRTPIVRAAAAFGFVFARGSVPIPDAAKATYAGDVRVVVTLLKTATATTR